MPGIIITTAVMMLAYGPGDYGYTGAAFEGVGFFPWVGANLSFIIEPIFGFTSPEAIAFPVTSLGSVGASLAMVPQFLESGIIDAMAFAFIQLSASATRDSLAPTWV